HLYTERAHAHTHTRPPLRALCVGRAGYACASRCTAVECQVVHAHTHTHTHTHRLTLPYLSSHINSHSHTHTHTHTHRLTLPYLSSNINSHSHTHTQTHTHTHTHTHTWALKLTDEQ